jgi:hypothetical protein
VMALLFCFGNLYFSYWIGEKWGNIIGHLAGHILRYLGIPAKISIFMLPKNTLWTYHLKENIFLTLHLSTHYSFFPFISFHRIMSDTLLG